MNEENAKQLLFAVDDALKEVGLSYCLGAGTLLGCIREERFIPIDRDIDLWMRAEEFEPNIGAITKALRARKINTTLIDYRNAGYWNGRPYSIKFYGYNEHGDLGGYTKLGPYRYEPARSAKGRPFCIVFPADAFEGWQTRQFYGRDVFVPGDATTILEQLYDTWQVPDVEYNQPCKHAAYIDDFLTKQNIAYVGMCLDVLHPGHINILNHARDLKGNKVVVGLLTDEAITAYKGPPVLKWEERRAIAASLSQVDEVVRHDDYESALLQYKPAYLVHGDDWKTGPQEAWRTTCFEMLRQWGGRVIEIPYTRGVSSSEVKARIREDRTA